jgi:hypothetical protein
MKTLKDLFSKCAVCGISSLMTPFAIDDLCMSCADKEAQEEQRKEKKMPDCSDVSAHPDLLEAPGKVVYIGKETQYVISAMHTGYSVQRWMTRTGPAKWEAVQVIPEDALEALKRLPAEYEKATAFSRYELKRLMDRRKEADAFSLFAFDVVLCNLSSEQIRVVRPLGVEVVGVIKIKLPEEISNHFSCFRYMVISRNDEQAKASLFVHGIESKFGKTTASSYEQISLKELDRLKAAPYFMNNIKFESLKGFIDKYLYGELITGGVPGGVPHHGKGPTRID